MTLGIYFAGVFITLLILVAVIVYAEETGKYELSERADSLWVFFLSVFWPIMWALFLLEVLVDLLKLGVSWVFKLVKRG